METRLLVSLNFLLLLATASGFSPVVVHQASKTHLNLQRLSSERGGGYKQDGVNIMPRRKDFLALLGTIVTSSIVSTSPAMAEEIKTFDLSLPSYDSINTLKITDEKALGVETPSGKDTTTKVKKTKEKRNGGDNNPLGNVLPSMNKKAVVKKSKPQKTVEKASKPEKDEKYETMDMALPSYSSSTESKEKDFFSIQK